MDDDRVMHAMSIDDMYHVERVLARGIGGVTELVTIEGSGPFVRKKMPLEQANRSVWSACADCGSKRLPQVEAMYELPDEFVVVYDFVPGDSVEKVVQSSGPIPPQQAVALARDLCEAAGALHALGIVHRDIAPTNIIVAEDGAHLIDLGIARTHKDGASRDGDTLGTWGYASPEQYGFAQTDPRSDIYSIGRVLAYMVTGVSPADDSFDTKLADESMVSPELRSVIAKATSFEPSARYQTTDEMAAELTALDAGKPTGAPHTVRTQVLPHALPPKDDGTPNKRTPRLSKWLIAAICVALALAVAVLVGRHLSATTHDAGTQNESVHPTGRTNSSDTSGGAASTNTVTTSDNEGTTASNTSAAADGALQVSNLEWNVTPDGMVIYLVSLTNTSEELTAELPSVTVTGADAQGNVTFSDDAVFSVAYPGQTVSMTNIVSSTGTTVDVTSSVNQLVEPLRQVPNDQWLTFEVSSTSRSTDALGCPVVTGLVTVSAGEIGTYTGIRVDVALRDADGKLVDVAQDYLSMPTVGSSTSFQASGMTITHEVASYEVYASPWW